MSKRGKFNRRAPVQPKKEKGYTGPPKRASETIAQELAVKAEAKRARRAAKHANTLPKAGTGQEE